MKTLLLIVFALFNTFSVSAQKTVWAKPFTHDITLVSSIHKVCTDNEANFYVMANFARKISFGTIELKSGSKSPDIMDAFIAKIDPHGETIFWGIQITSLGNVDGKSMCTDKDNNLYVTGSFEGETSFGSIIISPKHKYGFFIAKYNSDGEVQWVKQGGNYETKWGIATAFGFAVKTDNSGNVYVAANVLGMHDDWIHDPSLPVEEQYLGKAYYEDESLEGDEFYTGNHTITLKLSSDGELIMKKVSHMFWRFADLDVDHEENIYMTGSMGGTIEYEGKKIEANGLSDIIVIKFDKEGKTIWLKQFGTGEPASSGAYAKTPAADIEGGQFITVDASGNVFFSGVHFNKARFDDQTLSSEANIKGLEVGNPFMAKLDKDGNIQWVKNADGKGYAGLTAMVSDKNGNTYISGAIGFKKVTFDGQKAKGPFIMKFDSKGEVQWIDDADSRDKSWAKTVKVRYAGISAMAINSTEDYLYTTGNASREIKESYYNSTTTSTETMMAISKVKTD